ncbi:trypsin alpha-like [Hyposmocoma kahamanoa]|uniref:trypsin alpha-like n=1 Tax=Hyposmocoma kahamanoa TaxID=1477025 RepID=UPI000E6D6069|nr:trypsin alpha-like [Hyposmocoma kahamanoa]
MEKIAFILALAVCYSGAVPVDENSGISRIINGGVAGSNDFPYAASLQLTSEATQPLRGHRCGGVLFTRQHSLTAASCLHDVVNGTPQMIIAQAYQVFAGARFFNETTPDRVRPVANFSIPDNFIYWSRLNDIAIVTLVSPFPATAVTIALPAVEYNPVDFTECTVAGWGGMNNSAVASQQLMFARKYIYNQHMCTLVFNPNLQMLNIMPTMLCAASLNSVTTSCQGDIGNALVCNNTLTGILFYDQNCGPSTFPELYTRVNNYTTWIRTVSRSSSTFAPGAFMLLLLSVLIFITA